MRNLILFVLLTMYPVCTIAADIPARNQVGAANMPNEIAPVYAPFEMPQPERPIFPEQTENIARNGAKQGKLSTASIQKTIDKLSQTGGGTVIIPAGKWLTGRITLKSNINLHLEEGAELYFSGEIKDYLPVVFTRNEGIEMYSLGALIYANGAENIAITGKGKLIAAGDDCEIYKRQMAGAAVEVFIPDALPIEKRIYDGKDGAPIFLPMFFAPINSKNILVEGVTFEKSIFWNIVPQYCENIIIRGVTVNSAGHGRTDGIDIESSGNVLIEYCTLSCGDDCFTIKSGRGEDGLRVNRPAENIVIRYSNTLQGAGGVTCGSETAGMIRNLYVHDCVFEGTHNGFYFKTRRPRGGGGENLHYERIRLNIPGPAFKWDMLGSRRWVGELADRLPARDITPLTPKYQNISFKDIIVENCAELISATGIPESPIIGVLISNMNAQCDKLITISDVDGFAIANSNIQSKKPDVSIADGRNIMLINTKLNIPEEKLQISYSGELSRPIMHH
ncbi:MAG: glycoside hydrolase family 28 protein [Tannerella sp.]|jgi:hypothetical protein|nr:glycoside hydrolase family 28 protein [Tannerella sp.]